MAAKTETVTLSTNPGKATLHLEGLVLTLRVVQSELPGVWVQAAATLAGKAVSIPVDTIRLPDPQRDVTSFIYAHGLAADGAVPIASIKLLSATSNTINLEVAPGPDAQVSM